MFASTKNHTKQRPGFSLVEVVVATAVLTIGLITLVGLIPFAIKANKKAEFQSLASTYARTKLEQLLASPYDEIDAGTIEPRTKISSDPSNPAYALERQTVVTLLDSNLAASSSDQGLKKITVTVYWPNRLGSSGSLTLTSILSQK